MASQEDEKLYALFYETVLMPYDEYRTIRADRKAGTRRDWKAAITASTSAYHFREHLPTQYKTSRKQLIAMCPDYSLLRDVVDAAKHGNLDRRDAQIVSANCICERVVVTIYRDKDGEFTNPTKSVEITLKDGTTRELFDVLTKVVNMWIAFFHAAGISNNSAPFPHEDPNQVISRQEAAQMNLEMVQGIAFGQGLKVQKYNYEKGVPEPVDLSGSTFSLSIYDPRKVKTEVEVQAISPEGKKYIGTLELDEDEKSEFYSITDEEERQRFMRKIVQRRGELVLRVESNGPAPLGDT